LTLRYGSGYQEPRIPKLPIVQCQRDMLKRRRQDGLSANGTCQAVQGLLVYARITGRPCGCTGSQSWLKRAKESEIGQFGNDARRYRFGE